MTNIWDTLLNNYRVYSIMNQQIEKYNMRFLLQKKCPANSIIPDIITDKVIHKTSQHHQTK